MLTINTNLSSLIAQGSMKSSTNKLNQAIERMTTGFKINHAKDNAANYSISTNMTTKLNAYDVAADNVAMGMDLVTTASDIISQMQDKASRLSALSTQARNGTYGDSSLSAINTEASSIMSEIVRLYNTSQYNGIELFNKTAYTIASHLPQAGESGFIEEPVVTYALGATNGAPTAKAEYNGFIDDPVTYTEEELEALLASGDIVALDNNVTSFTNGQRYLITDKSELQRLATLVNSGNDSTGAIFILGADIDLSGENWTPIGDYSTNTSYVFKGTFDGNGHVIKNLTIDDETKDYQGLFGYAASGSVIKNVGIEGGSVKGKYSVGGLVGYSYSSFITNCYSTGDVMGTGDNVGGLVGLAGSISNSYATGTVSAGSFVGGLVGRSYSSITNSYATGTASGNTYIGGLAGHSSEASSISDSYAMGDVSGRNSTGGLVGTSQASISNCYATGKVSGSVDSTGGLVGTSQASISNCYATGKVTGSENNTGGLVGFSFSSSSSIINSYATGDVSGRNSTGGLVGYSDSLSSSISNSYATGTVSGDTFIGGLVGRVYRTNSTITISDSVSYSIVTGNNSDSIGSLVGGAVLTEDGTSFGTLTLTGCESISQDMNTIGGVYEYASSTYALLPDYDMTTMLAGMRDVAINPVSTTLQVGINSDTSSRLTFNTNFLFDLSAIEAGIETESAFYAINDFINLLSEKATMLGAIQNRLESALESIEVNINNLTSSRSTIRDADIAEVSSHYIQQQILQQASATLLATANQSPAIALQLI